MLLLLLFFRRPLEKLYLAFSLKLITNEACYHFVWTKHGWKTELHRSEMIAKWGCIWYFNCHLYE